MCNLSNKKKYKFGDMLIVEYYRFEGMFNLSDLLILFVVEIYSGDKGIIVFFYGIYVDMDFVEFLDKVCVKECVSV